MAAAADAEEVQKVPDWVMQCVEMIWEECEKISPGKEVHTIEDVKKASEANRNYPTFDVGIYPIEELFSRCFLCFSQRSKICFR